MRNRIRTVWRAKGLERELRALSSREDGALARTGARVFQALRAPESSNGARAEAGDGFSRLCELSQRQEACADALARSLEADRRDFADASELARWAVIGRGVLDRAALRDRAKREARERAGLELDLGRRALDGSGARMRELVPRDHAEEVARIRGDAQRAREALAELVAPYGGQPLPAWMAAIARETRRFLGFVWDHLSKRLFLRAPALAGLLVGWWIGQRFSDSAIVRWAHDNVGLDLRGSSEKRWHETLAFWLPLLAAALCSYVGWLVADRVRKKYGTAAADDGAAQRASTRGGASSSGIPPASTVG